MGDVKTKKYEIKGYSDLVNNYNGNYYRLNKNLIKLLDGYNGAGFRNTAFYDYLFTLYRSYYEKGELNKDGYMFLTSMKIKAEFHVEYKTQYRMFAFLEEKVKFIETIVPLGEANKYIKLNLGEMNKYINIDFNDVPTIKMEDEEVKLKRKEKYAGEKIKKTLSKQMA